jgi:hypothetical protein
MEFLAQGMGILAFLIFIGSMGTDTKEQYYRLFALSSFAFGIHYVLMGEIGLTAITIFAVIRTGSFSTKFGYQNRLPIGISCMICAVITTMYFEQTIWTYLFCLSMCLTVFSEISAKMFFIRINHVSQRLLYLTYYLLIGSIGGIMAEVCCLYNLARKLKGPITVQPVALVAKA